MNNSNYTLRFSRTAREAFGHSLDFHERHHERWILYLACFVLGVLCGGLFS